MHFYDQLSFPPPTVRISGNSDPILSPSEARAAIKLQKLLLERMGHEADQVLYGTEQPPADQYMTSQDLREATCRAYMYFHWRDKFEASLALPYQAPAWLPEIKAGTRSSP